MLRLGDVHEHQFWTRQWRQPLEIDQRPDPQGQSLRSLRYGDCIADAPAHLCGQLRGEGRPAALAKGLRKIDRVALPRHPHGGEKIDADNIEKKILVAVEHRPYAHQGPSRLHPGFRQHVHIERFGQCGHAAQDAQIGIAAHRLHAALEGRQRVQVDDLNGQHRGHPQGHAQHRQQE